MKRVLSLLMAVLMLFGTVMSVTVAPLAAESDYTYEELMDGTVSITGYSGKVSETEPRTQIPRELDGKTVSTIGVGAFASYHSSDVIDVELPTTVKKIDIAGFNTANMLQFIMLNEGLEEIGMMAFSHSDLISEIHLPSTLKKLAEDAFDYMDSLSAITVSAANPYFTAVDGVLFNVDKTVLLKYPQHKSGSSYVVPDTVTKINPNAFNNSTLTTVELPASLTEVEDGAFSDCSQLTSVIYHSTKSDWAKIAIQDNNEPLLNAQMTYICREHQWDDGVVAPEATCGSKGIITYTCTECGETRTEEIPATGEHQYGKGDVAVQPTCINEGYRVYTCSVCGDSYAESIPATGVHNYDSGVVTKEPTCSEEGVITYTCVDCGVDSYTDKIPATGAHTVATKEEVIEEATCGAEGSKTVITYCTVCSQELSRTAQSIPATGEHSEASREEIVEEATCSKAGRKDIVTYCTVCHQELSRTTQSIPATGKHTLATKEEIIEEATCVKKGSEYVITYCSVCQQELERKKVELPATGEHQYKKTVTKATLTKDGSIVVKCAVCNKLQSSQSIPAPTDITLEKIGYVFKGSAIEPKVYVKDAKGKTIAASNYTVTYLNNTDVGRATAVVAFKGNYSGTKQLNFRLIPKTTQITALTSTKNSFAVKWMKINNCDGYQVIYWEKGQYSKAKTLTVSSKASPYKKITGLTKGKNYYVQVRTYKKVVINGKNKIYYGRWSTRQHVKI